MFGAGWLNLGSLVLGLIAWGFPVINLAHRDKAANKSWVVFSAASIGACAISLNMQILYTEHLVRLEDWSALLDTSHAVALVATLLLTVTVILNAITLAVYLGKKLKGCNNQ